MPMDETLAVAAVDLSGRPHAVVDLKVKVRMVGDLQSELVHDFFDGFAAGARANVHAKVLYGRSSHHHVEAVFKAFARALRVACAQRRAAGEDAAEHEGAAVIALIDYGAGNLTSVRKALTALGAEFMTPEHAGRRAPARRASSFPASATSRRRSALDEAVARRDRRRRHGGTPLLGICVGMQWLFEGSDEAPGVPGLGVLPGRIARLRRRRRAAAEGPARRLERAGLHAPGAPAARARQPGAQVYFTHSYAAPVTADCVAADDAREPFAAAVERDNIFGVQFHPEKSGDAGLQILRNFLDARMRAR